MEIIKRFMVLLGLLAVMVSMAWSRDRVGGWCEEGGKTVTVAGMISSASTLVQRSYPSCTVTVYVTGTATLATLYSDDSGTPLANPFTANLAGYWYFYANNGRYDVTFSGGGITTPFTLGDFELFDPSGAVGISSLNALTATSQVFANDTNVTMTSAGVTHSLGWTGLLAVARGGTGASSFTTDGVVLGGATLGSSAAGAAYQIFRVPSGGGSPAFGSIDLSSASAVTGTLALANGGLGITSGTSGGIPYFSAASTIASSGALTANRLVLGGGAGAAPTILGSLGTTTTLLHGNAAGAPTWGAVNLASDITGTLPLANGGTGLVSGTSGGVLAFTGTSTLTSSAALAQHALTLGGGVGAVPYSLGSLGTSSGVLHGNAAGDPTWGALALATEVSGTLAIANGGTGQVTQTDAFDALSPTTALGDLVVFDGTDNVRLAAGTNSKILAADSTATEGVKWAPGPTCSTYTVDYTDPVFIAASTTADVNLFTLGQYQKIMGVTVKHSNIFGDGAGAITDVSVSLGVAGSVTFFTAVNSIGEATPVADAAYQDTAMFKSSTMAAAGASVLAHFIATGGNFGDGAVTNLTEGNLSVWVCSTLIQ